MKSVGLIIDVSAAVGMGHLSRSSVLARSLLSTVNVHVYLYGELSERVNTVVTRVLAGLRWSVLPLPQPQAERQVASRRVNHMSDNVLSADDHNAWLVDLSTSSQTCFAECFLPILRRALALDWFVSQHLPATTISLVDHGNVMRNAYARDHNTGLNDGQLFCGAAFAVLKPQIIELAQRNGRVARSDTELQSESAEKANRLLLTFGGSDPSACTIKAVRALLPQSKYIKHVTIVIGVLNELEQDELKDLLAGVPHEIIFNPEDFERRLSNADVVLCGGGGTLLEAMHLGKPCVVFAQNTDEREHAACYERRGACVWPEQLADVLQNHQLRLDLAHMAVQQVDGQGVARITSKLLEQLQ